MSSVSVLLRKDDVTLELEDSVVSDSESMEESYSVTEVMELVWPLSAIFLFDRKKKKKKKTRIFLTCAILRNKPSMKHFLGSTMWMVLVDVHKQR